MLDFYIQFREKTEIECLKCNTEKACGFVLALLWTYFTWNPSELLTVNLQKLQDIVKTLRDENEDTDCRKVKVKVKFTLVQALRLCTGRTAHRGSRGIALPFLDRGTKRG